MEKRSDGNSCSREEVCSDRSSAPVEDSAARSVSHWRKFCFESWSARVKGEQQLRRFVLTKMLWRIGRMEEERESQGYIQLDAKQ